VVITGHSDASDFGDERQRGAKMTELARSSIDTATPVISATSASEELK
jgi:hypothetical protein